LDHPADYDERNGRNFVRRKINFHKRKEIVYKKLRVMILTTLNKQLKGRNMKLEEEKRLKN
jgi:hypothetical protein